MTKLRERSARMWAHGAEFFGRSQAASRSLFERTRLASRSFASETRVAGDHFLTETRTAGRSFAGGVQAEALQIAALLREAARAPIRLPRRADVRRDVLKTVHTKLHDLEVAVERRIEELDAKPPAKLARTNGGGASHVAGDAPIRGYDDMTAKDIVGRIGRLTDDQAAAVLSYERANKARATILRAAEQRIAEEP